MDISYRYMAYWLYPVGLLRAARIDGASTVDIARFRGRYNLIYWRTVLMLLHLTDSAFTQGQIQREHWNRPIAVMPVETIDDVVKSLLKQSRPRLYTVA